MQFLHTDLHSGFIGMVSYEQKLCFHLMKILNLKKLYFYT